MSDSYKLDLSKFEDITVKTAKCNICNNKDFVHRCLRCRAGWCNRCRSLNTQHLGHPLAHFNCEHSPVELVGNPQNSPHAWWIRNPPSYRATNPGALARPEILSNLQRIANNTIIVPNGNPSSTIPLGLRLRQRPPSRSGLMAPPPKPHITLPLREAARNKTIDKNVGRSSDASIHRSSLPHILSTSRNRQHAPSPEPESSTLDLSDHCSDVIHTKPVIKKPKPKAGNVSGPMGVDRTAGIFGTYSPQSNRSAKNTTSTTRINKSARPKTVTQQPKRPYVSQSAAYPGRYQPSETPARDPQTSAPLHWSAPMRNTFPTSRYDDPQLQGLGPCRYTDPITGELIFTVQTHGQYRWIHFGRNSESIGIYRESPTERAAFVDRQFIARIDPTSIGSEPVVEGRDIAMTIRGITPGSERLGLVTETSAATQSRSQRTLGPNSFSYMPESYFNIPHFIPPPPRRDTTTQAVTVKDTVKKDEEFNHGSI